MLSKNLLDEIKRKSEELEALKPLAPENQAKLDKKFRLEFNFNSNHLEGNTLTYGETELLLIFDQTEGTHDYREYQEMQAHDVALKMIQEEASETERPLTENFIRSLNEHILVRPFWKDAITQTGESTRKKIIPGQYKTTPNSVRLSNDEVFHYTSPTDVPNEMAELVSWYNENRLEENAVILASILHYRFVRIHPFDDGNGRTARLLMNYVLAENNLPLIVIKSSAKKEYLTALNRADAGDLKSFVEYIGQQLLWSLDLSITAAKGGDIDDNDDLDKELELLKKDLNRLPNEFEKQKSSDEVALLMDKSIVPLFNEFNAKIEKIQELFVEVNSFVYLKTFGDNISSTTQSRFNSDSFAALKNADYFSSSDFGKKNITEASIELSFIALKKTVEKKDISYSLSIRLDEYHYMIYDNVLKNDIIKMPYGQYFTKLQINAVVKKVLGYIVEEIKSLTNTN